MMVATGCKLICQIKATYQQFCLINQIYRSMTAGLHVTLLTITMRTHSLFDCTRHAMQYLPAKRQCYIGLFVYDKRDKQIITIELKKKGKYFHFTLRSFQYSWKYQTSRYFNRDVIRISQSAVNQLNDRIKSINSLL